VVSLSFFSLPLFFSFAPLALSMPSGEGPARARSQQQQQENNEPLLPAPTLVSATEEDLNKPKRARTTSSGGGGVMGATTTTTAAATDNGARNNAHHVIDEDLHSRQLAVYGRESMRRMAGTTVLISGLGGLGAETGER